MTDRASYERRPHTRTDAAPSPREPAGRERAAPAGQSGHLVAIQRVATPQRHAAVLALQRTVGNAGVGRLLRGAPETSIQRVSFGTDGPLSPAHQETVRTAAEIAERLVAPTSGPYTFRRQWEAFWRGPGQLIDPKPTLAQYQAAVRNRVVNDMDTSTEPGVRAVVEEDRGFPLERHTGAVTRPGSTMSYFRRFAIDQGIDTVTNYLLHESLHGAGLPEGPLMAFEPLFHQFEADVGFPMMMGGGDITGITQVRRGDYNVDVTVAYRLRKIGGDPIPASLEIQIVSAETGEVVYDEQPDGSQQPARHPIASKPGAGKWSWRARYPGWSSYTVRIRDLTTPTLLASRGFKPNPRCILGVSSKHCEDDK